MRPAKKSFIAMSEPRDLRKRHSLMEAQRSSSYAIFADAPEYWSSYDSYFELFARYAAARPVVNILNVGSATGIMENLALWRMDNLHFVSVDNSLSFREMYEKKNEMFIKEGKAEHVLTDILAFNTRQRFDIIVSRDFNHHLGPRDVERYIRKCIRFLAPGGVMVIEDLKHEALVEGTVELIRITCQIPAFKEDVYNCYHKIEGIRDSYLVSYSTEEIRQVLLKTGVRIEEDPSRFRYKFLVTLP